MHTAQVMGGVQLHVRAHVQMCPPFPYLGNGWMDCAEIWFVVSAGETGRERGTGPPGLHKCQFLEGPGEPEKYRHGPF